MRRLTILLATAAAFLLVPAAQSFAAQTSKVNITGAGSGEVVSYNGGEFFEDPGTPPIACSYNGTSKSGVCENAPGESEPESFFYTQALKAIPAPGSGFGGWTIQSGSGTCPSAEECFIGSSEEEGGLEISAVFIKNPTLLKVEKVNGGAGTGTIVSSPAGIECGVVCAVEYEKGTTVTLTASPEDGHALSSWSGCTEHAGLTCKVKLEKATTVKATYINTPSLSISKGSSTGAGKVSTTGISCDENCSTAAAAIKKGTVVTFKATPAKGSEAAVFSEGKGSASGCSGATCTFTIEEPSSVTVKFKAIPTNPLTVSLLGPGRYKGKVTGKGTVKGLTAAAINCGSGCISQTESFFSTDTVELSAVAGIGYTFAGWSGGPEAGTCTGKTTPCKVSTSANKSLKATFE